MESKHQGNATTCLSLKNMTYGLLYLSLVSWINYFSYQLSVNSCDDLRAVSTEGTVVAPATKATTTKILPTSVDYPSSSIWSSRDELYQSLLALLHFAPVFEDFTTTSTLTTDQLLILQNFVRSPAQPRDDIVLVTYTTCAQLNSLSRLLRQWAGPASVAVYLNTPTGVECFVDYYLSTTTGDDVPAWAHQVRYHLVIKTVTLSENYYHIWAAPPIPYDVLRNVALHSSDADYFLSVDANVVPKPSSTYRYLKEWQEEDPDLWKQTFIQEKRLLFLPTFAPVDGTRARLPGTARDLYDLVKRKKWTPKFSLLLDQKQALPVRKTQHWIYWSEDEALFCEPLTDEDPSSIVWVPNLMGYRPGIHRFYEGSRGSTFGKYGFLAESVLAGYSFGVLADVYGLYPEKDENWMTSMDDELSEYQGAFQEYLDNRYPDKKSKSRTVE